MRCPDDFDHRTSASFGDPSAQRSVGSVKKISEPDLGSIPKPPKHETN